MNILLTGGAGFIGSNIADKYIENGHKVIIVDNLITGKEENLNSNALFYKCNICDLEGLDRIFREHKIDIINHHAAQMDVTKSVKEPSYDAEVNIKGGINILELYVKYKVKKIIYSSTGGAVYGEPQFLPCTEEHPICPGSHYGLSKFVLEEYIKLYDRLYGVEYTILRYPNVYGPRQNPHGEAGVNAIFILKMLKGEVPIIYGDGSCMRDYLYVDDVVCANVLCLDKGNKEVFNLSTECGITVKQVFDTIRKYIDFDKEPIYKELRKGEIWQTYLKSAIIYKKLGWESKVSFEQGIEKTIEWFRS